MGARLPGSCIPSASAAATICSTLMPGIPGSAAAAEGAAGARAVGSSGGAAAAAVDVLDRSLIIMANTLGFRSTPAAPLLDTIGVGAGA